MKKARSIYGGDDPLNMPLYSMAEAARYASISAVTLRSWVAGRVYPTQEGARFFEPLIKRPTTGDSRLSFTNLIEAHVLRALRRTHLVPMGKVREALDYAQKEFNIQRLLISEQLRAGPAGELFLRQVGDLVNLTRAGQLAMKRILDAHLKRVVHENDNPVKLYPMLPDGNLGNSRRILIDPHVSFGRPVLVKVGVATAILAERYDAGEQIDEIAHDYEIEVSDVEAAIVYEKAA